ncbi:hydrogenase expression/formation protein HupK [Thalassovita sp.]|uniref:hydrogenase expression/formation protein HupK n=1 Tax=Thalassovita sp. TaxID=1979401 RepID=UPI00288268E0|nr:hydrogenase expression/formation protein HupK [Thalassovita sp.]MDF1803405.1 hydrogenase expression/formation protein HupK [Thalassovita sp.]
MLDHPLSRRLIAHSPPALPVAALVLGKPVEEVADLLPRLFNLCRAAQQVAVRGALGLPISAQDKAEVANEIQREHEMKLGVLLPLAFGLSAGEAPTVFPATPDAFEMLLGSGSRMADLLNCIIAAFPPGQAVARRLPLPETASVFIAQALENSVAARVADHPVMLHVEAQYGRGPLWRVVARLVELQRLRRGWLPGVVLAERGVIVPAARGTYAVRAVVQSGRVDAFHRVTPTDHMLASGGVLESSLTTLTDLALGSKLLAILDPCCPVELKKAQSDA